VAAQGTWESSFDDNPRIRQWLARVGREHATFKKPWLRKRDNRRLALFLHSRLEVEPFGREAFVLNPKCDPGQRAHVAQSAASVVVCDDPIGPARQGNRWFAMECVEAGRTVPHLTKHVHLHVPGRLALTINQLDADCLSANELQGQGMFAGSDCSGIGHRAAEGKSRR
jgi:hypothetical protein